MSAYSQRPTLPELITRVRADLRSAFDSDDVLRHSDNEVFARAYSAAVHSVYGYIAYLEKNLLPDLADEDWLYRHAAMKKCPRKDPEISRGFARWVGAGDGIAILAGTTLQDMDNPELQFIVTERAVSSGGILRAPVESLSAGAATNLDDGRQLMLTEPVSGLSSVAAADSISGGTDIEDIELWRARVIDRCYYIPQGGADHDYEIWAKEVSGITDAWAYRNWMGLGTVGIACVDYSSEAVAPSDEILRRARAHIEPKSPVAGTELYLFAPVINRVQHRIRVTPDTAAVRAAIDAELKAFYIREGRPESTIEISRLSEAISSANGEYKHELLSPAAPITVPRGQVAYPGETSWT
nr:baseplate J/gp47 family protein [Plesiomonas shigelloides]